MNSPIRRKDISKRTDFCYKEYFGYVSDDGETITGQVCTLNKKHNDAVTARIFVHFTYESSHMKGKPYRWLSLSDERTYTSDSRELSNEYLSTMV